MTKEKLEIHRTINKLILIPALLSLVGLTTYLWTVLPQPILVFSIPIRLMACTIALLAYLHWRDWRVLPLALMFFLMACRQILTLYVRSGIIERTQITTTLSDVPGFIVTLLAFFSIIYLWRIFSYQGKEAEIRRQLLHSEEKFRAMADYACDWEEWLLPDGSSQYISPSCEQISGYTPDTFKNNPSLGLDIIHPDDWDRVAVHQLDHLNENSKLAELEYRIITATGKVRWIHHKCQAIFSRDNVWLGRRITNRDITIQKQLDEELKISEERLSMALMGGNLGLWDWNMETNEEVVNERWANMLGLDLKDIQPHVRAWKERIHPEDLAWVQQRLDAHYLDETPYFEVEHRLRTKSAGWIWVLAKGKIVERDKDGNPLRMVGTHFDISQRKKREEQKHQEALQVEAAQRYKSLNVMAGAIAHHFNNIMMVVQGNLELLQMELQPDSMANRMASEAQLAAKRASEISTSMLTYVGQRPSHKKISNLSLLIADMEDLLLSNIDSGIETIFTYDQTSLYGKFDPVQIRQIILNLVLNAAESIAGTTGRISIVTGVSSEKAADFPTPFRDNLSGKGQFIYCDIIDTGCGMDKKTIHRMFDPFFSTKFTGRGLGLAEVVGYAKANDGALKVESRPGQGTRIRLLLPLRQDKAIEERNNNEAKSSDKNLPSFSGLVLLADDEEMIRNVGGKILKKFGFKILLAEDGLEAFDLYQKQGKAIRLVILDVSMPNRDGIWALQQILTINDQARVILASGFSEDQLPPIEGAKQPAAFIRKPFQMQELAAVIREVLKDD